jgi:hypothetical protein
LDQGGDSEETEVYDDLLNNIPDCLSNTKLGKRAYEDEIKALTKLKNELEADGLIFHKRVINAFHTSLKCHDINPLTVLAGVSGTGKTLLPVRYAELMGMHLLVMAVQPRWDNPQDLFGYYHSLEKKYKATDLSRALVRMDPYNFPDLPDKDPNISSKLLLVLIDEMNLARTEYYFSEFLSKLELRRTVNDKKSSSQRVKAELELDSMSGGKPMRIWVPDNIFFVGTMNEDESTQTLSDKVLDRSNVLRFGKPEKLTPDSSPTAIKQKINPGYLGVENWQKWLKNPEKNKNIDVIRKYISDINDILSKMGRPFGYRIAQAIEMYVANYPSQDDNWHLTAFADQIEQKILPKLQGLDLTNEKNTLALNQIQSLIDKDLKDRDLLNAFNQAYSSGTSQSLFTWHGVSRKESKDNN